MELDKDGSLWACYVNNGFFQIRYSETQFNEFELPVLNTKESRAQHIDVLKWLNEETVLIGMNEGDGLYIYNVKSKQVSVCPAPGRKGKAHFIKSILQLEDGRWLVVSPSSLYEFIPSENRLIPFQQETITSSKIQNANIRVAKEALSGEIWFGTYRRGIYRLDKEGAFTNWKINSKKKDGAPYLQFSSQIDSDEHGRVWFGGDLSVLIWHPNKESFTDIKLYFNDSLDINNILDLEVKGGSVWALLENQGLIVADTNATNFVRQKRYKLVDDLPRDKYHAFTFDLSGDLWLAGNRGLTRLDTATGAHRLFQFSREGGHDLRYCDLVTAPDGSIWYGVGTSVLWFDPIKLSEVKEFASEVILSEFMVNGKNALDIISAEQQIELTWQTNNFSFEAAVLDFRKPALNRFAYYLEGYDKDWINSGKRRSASYGNLKAGDFTLKIKGANAAGIWSDEILSIPIKVVPPFWRTSWFYLLLALSVMGILYLLYLFRIRTIKDKEKLTILFNKQLAEVEMKALKAQMNPHFLFNSLTSIKMYVIRNDAEVASEYLEKFSRLVRLILNHSDQKAVPLSEEIEALKLYTELEQVRFSHSFDVDFDIGDIPDAAFLMVAPMLIQPYIENAIRHGLRHKKDNGQLKISVSKEKAGLKWRIEDNGVGRKAAAKIKNNSHHKSESKGMRITSDRLKLLNTYYGIAVSAEIIDLFSEDGNPAGTRVNLFVPILPSEEEI